MILAKLFEAVSGSLLVLDLFILGVFIVYIWRNLSDYRERHKLIDIYRYAPPNLRAAVGIATFFFGATIGRAAMWSWRVALNRGVPVEAELRDALLATIILAVVICCVGGFCVLRVFSEPGGPRQSAILQWSAGILIAGMVAFALV